jgi:hypothetical protein
MSLSSSELKEEIDLPGAGYPLKAVAVSVLS